jgi:hypothetical protein
MIYDREANGQYWITVSATASSSATIMAMGTCGVDADVNCNDA